MFLDKKMFNPTVKNNFFNETIDFPDFLYIVGRI
jgi:hypothetical protein